MKIQSYKCRIVTRYLEIDDNFMKNTGTNTTELDPVKIVREDQIIFTLLELTGELRAKMTDREMYLFLKPQYSIQLESLELTIKNEGLDSWILSLVREIKKRFITNFPIITTVEESRDADIVMAVFDLWYYLKWEAFDASSKLILLEGIEQIILEEAANQKLLRILDLTKNLAKTNIQTELSIKALS